jgi:hypothetical protein
VKSTPQERAEGLARRLGGRHVLKPSEDAAQEMMERMNRQHKQAISAQNELTGGALMGNGSKRRGREDANAEVVQYRDNTIRNDRRPKAGIKRARRRKH